MKIFIVVSYLIGIPIAVSLVFLYVFPPLIYLYFIFSRILHPSLFLSLFLSFPHNMIYIRLSISSLSLSHSLCLLLSSPSSLSLPISLFLSLFLFLSLSLSLSLTQSPIFVMARVVPALGVMGSSPLL